MEKDKDENVPPAEENIRKIPGYLSPFGIISEIRSRFSPSVKSTPAQPIPQNVEASISPTARPVLKDVNTMGVKGYPSISSSPQGGGAQAEDLSSAATRDKKSSEDISQSWKSDRTSLASESSFVSAVSAENTSLPDLLLPEATYRNGVESDTDTSTVYESAGENEGNVSAVEDQLSSFSETFSVDPIAVSSPLYRVAALDGTIVVDYSSDSSKTSTPCSDEVTVREKNRYIHRNALDCHDSEGNAANVSVSDLVDHLTTLSLKTPQKPQLNPTEVLSKKGDSVEEGSKVRGHITLDSDVSADLIESIEVDLCNQSSEVHNESCTNGLKLNKTIDLSSDASDYDVGTANNTHIATAASNKVNDNCSTIRCVTVSPTDQSHKANHDSKVDVEIVDDASGLTSNSPGDISSVKEELQSYFNVSNPCLHEITPTEQNLLEALSCTANSSVNSVVFSDIQSPVGSKNSPIYTSPSKRDVVSSSVNDSVGSVTPADVSSTELKLLQDLNRTYDFTGTLNKKDSHSLPDELEVLSQADDSSSNTSVVTVESDGDVTVVSVNDNLECGSNVEGGEVSIKSEKNSSLSENSDGAELKEKSLNANENLITHKEDNNKEVSKENPDQDCEKDPTKYLSLPECTVSGLLDPSSEEHLDFSNLNTSCVTSNTADVCNDLNTLEVISESEIPSPNKTQLQNLRSSEEECFLQPSDLENCVESYQQHKEPPVPCEKLTVENQISITAVGEEALEESQSILLNQPNIDEPRPASPKPDDDNCSSLNGPSPSEHREEKLDSDQHEVRNESPQSEYLAGQTDIKSQSTNFDDIPLPARKPRSFEEILAEQLGVESLVDSDTTANCPVKDSCPSEKSTPPVGCKILSDDKIGEPSTDSSEITESVDLSEGERNIPSDADSHHLHQGSPESVKSSVSPSKNFDEVPVQSKKHRTFEEILLAELASEKDAVLAVPSFSKKTVVTAPSTEVTTSLSNDVSSNCASFNLIQTFDSSIAAANLNETLGNILALETTTIEAESEPHIESEELSKDKVSSVKCGDSLESLIEKCKLQEMDLQDNAVDISAKADCPNPGPEKLSQGSDTSREIGEGDLSINSSSPEVLHQTVIMAHNGAADNCNPFSPKPKVALSPPMQRRGIDNSNLLLSKVKEASSPPSRDVKSDHGIPGRGMGVQEKTTENQYSDTNGCGDALDLDAEEFVSGDVFKDPSAFDFLSLHGGTNSLRDLRKESLYVKFDPLVGTFTSNTSSGLPQPTMQPTQPENSLPNESSEAAALLDSSRSSEDRESNSPVCQLPQDHLKTPSSTVSVDKLISLSPASSKKAQDNSSDLGTNQKSTPSKSTPVKTPAHIMLNETLEEFGSRGSIVTQEDVIKKLQQHQSVLAEQDKAYQERIGELEERIQNEKKRHQEEKDLLNKQLQEKVQSLGELKLIMKEYEKTISRLVAEKNQEKVAFEEQHETLIKDRDQAQQHLNNMEIAFSDIHTKYERLKTVVEAFKKNEEALNTALSERQADLEKMQNMYEMLKSHAVSKLEKANQDLEGIKQKHQQEAAKLKAMVKKLEVKTKSLEESLQQKTKENQALTTICDELINKVGE